MDRSLTQMTGADLFVVRRTASAGAAADLAEGITLLRAVAAGERPATLRLYRPEPTVAFGQRDTRLPGFPAAEEAARALGFEPLVRRAGGRAAAYHRGCLVIDHVEPQTDAVAGSRNRFSGFGELLASALRSVGVTAAVGEIPGEYCPGEYSVHGIGDDGRRVKLVGTAQRVVAGAWLFSSVIVVEDSAPIREVLTSSYAAMGLDWDPATAGAANDLVRGLTVGDVEDAVLAAYRRAGYGFEPSETSTAVQPSAS
ncbi:MULTISPECIES: lipoate--protein ligase family protein [unclassified Arthrobacter]|uniref:lipoate--protein ligase family protein n=1 Tax=unclassified Arthrobacter TaxID=235627 RepID=UPI00031D6F6C|nr:MULTISPECIES: lipoate--protein ligase family protein [unclassified Arthrobacter]